MSNDVHAFHSRGVAVRGCGRIEAFFFSSTIGQQEPITANFHERRIFPEDGLFLRCRKVTYRKERDQIRLRCRMRAAGKDGSMMEPRDGRRTLKTEEVKSRGRGKEG